MPRPDHVLGQGRSLILGTRDEMRGEFVSRLDASGYVAILAVNDRRELLLTEQYRPALGKRTLELPGGLAGDEPLNPDEPLLAAAKRRLYEESGYEALKWWSLFNGPLAPTICDEELTMFLATQLTRVSGAERLGADGEVLRTHVVPIRDLTDFVQRAEERNCAIDYRVHAALAVGRSHPMFPV